MKLKFDGTLQFQHDAVSAVTSVFEGQSNTETQSELSAGTVEGELIGFSNRLTLSEAAIFDNIQRIQEQNQIPSKDRTEKLQGMHFTVEMETGTGKTYVYLRTIYEMHKQYGFKKFIIVVPSVAIREGVMKNLQVTHDHLQAIYNKPPIDFWIYNSKQRERLRHFCQNNALQVLILNIDAFNKDTNVMHLEDDRLSGNKPINFIQATNPIVIIDEPQNMESGKAKAAIESLNPLCTFRYSATHKDLYNLVYKLDPVKAYDMRLVKRITVTSVVERDDFNQPFIEVQDIIYKPSIKATLIIDQQQATGVSRGKVTLKKAGESLLDKSGGREHYKDYVVEEINAGEEYIQFTNGVRLSKGETHGSNRDAIMKVQVQEAVKAHFDKELQIQRLMPEGKRLKVLTLFFVDKVDNYFAENGKIRVWFEEAYSHLATQAAYKKLNPQAVQLVHNGYFSKSKGIAKDTTGTTKADEEAYELIMKDKERLLSLEEPVKFIFSHSALREGWDNPNVFQVCTLNELQSVIGKRQQIGRGLRLPVYETGERCFDEQINKLTVIANESFDEFARKLQTEIEDECGVSFGNRIENNRERRKLTLKKNWNLDPHFVELWNRIKHRTRYSVSYSVPELIKEASKAVKEMQEIHTPQIQTRRASLSLTSDGVSAELTSVKDTAIEVQLRIPDVVGYIQKDTELTRSTITEILIGSGRLKDLAKNPQQFMDYAVKTIKLALNHMIVNGIKYERIEGQAYEMRLFESQELESYLSRIIEVNDSKSLYDAVEIDSEIERDFAAKLNTREDIKLFFKLPSWFKIDTPLGGYNPDWAIVKEEDNQQKLYLVRETKGTLELEQLRPTEKQKIKCGKAHFAALPEVSFAVVTSAEQV
jgi:type III restriction enzyme